MKNVNSTRWKNIDWRYFESQLFYLQRKAFNAELRGDSQAVRKYQNRIANSFCAKALAVLKVAKHRKGKNTAGIDGVKSLQDAEMMQMAEMLSIQHRPSSVRRVWIPKPGKEELRPLGIPNMIDRAHQALLVSVLEPVWEAHLSNHQYGFRRGRGTHDAVNSIQRRLRKTGPQWVLEVDIEKFFDSIDHDELLRRINTQPDFESAIRRCLKAGVDELPTNDAPTVGTPQGGPLSPLLANIAMSGLEAHLESEFRREYKGRITRTKCPRLVIYADDAVILHNERSVVEWCRTVIENYLSPLGLKLNHSKTKISHTQSTTTERIGAGFDFLGFHIQHVCKKSRGGIKVPYIMVTPSDSAVSRFYHDCAELLDQLKLTRKQRGARRDRQARGGKDPVTIKILQLNRRIRGWGTYFRKANAKTCFSRMDHLIHQKLWIWAKRRFKKKRVQWIIDHMFSGVELDRDGNPLLRLDGNPRERKWAFKSPFVPSAEPHATLLKLADIQIVKHILVKPEKRFFDGDWPYWQLRMKTRYPGTPPMVSIAAYRRQKGKCSICTKRILIGVRLTAGKRDRYATISHHNCSTPLDSVSTNNIVNSGQSIACKPGARKRARRVSAERSP